MKKGKIITAAILVATMLMGAGYASWTSNTNIHQNVNTGKMDVQFIPCTYDAGPFFSQYVQADKSITNDFHDITFTLNNLYPGASYYTFTEEKNAGTIGVKFDKAEITFDNLNNNNPDKDKIGIIKDNMTVDYLECFVLNAKDKVIKDITFDNSIKLDKLDVALNQALNGVTLEPGEYLRFAGRRAGKDAGQFMVFTLNDATNLDNSTQLKSLQFTIHLDWKQFNK